MDINAAECPNATALAVPPPGVGSLDDSALDNHSLSFPLNSFYIAP